MEQITAQHAWRTRRETDKAGITRDVPHVRTFNGLIWRNLLPIAHDGKTYPKSGWIRIDNIVPARAGVAKVVKGKGKPAAEPAPTPPEAIEATKGDAIPDEVTQSSEEQADQAEETTEQVEQEEVKELSEEDIALIGRIEAAFDAGLEKGLNVNTDLAPYIAARGYDISTSQAKSKILDDIKKARS